MHEPSVHVRQCTNKYNDILACVHVLRKFVAPIIVTMNITTY